MDADVDNAISLQAGSVRLHVRRLLMNLVLHEKKKASDFTKALADLKELAHRTNAAALFDQPDHANLLRALPAAVYATDPSGFIIFYNDSAVALRGRRPVLGEDQWCGSWRMFYPDGTPMRHEDCPLARALREKRDVRDIDAIAERPDGTRVHFMAFPTLLYDPSDRVVGAVNLLVDLRATAVLVPVGGWERRS
jgi:PAS domain-containing protein